MRELLAFYRQLSTLETGLLLFPLGLVFGSFLTAVQFRVPRGQSFWTGRSQCPECGHALGPLELVPLLSFIWQRARCRHCGARISWRYPLIELGFGLSAYLAGTRGGWDSGVEAILLCSAVLGAWAVRERWSCLRKEPDQGGTTLVEVVVAVGLLTLVAIPMLDFVAGMRGSTAFQRQIAATLASAKIEELANGAYRTSATTWPPSDSEGDTVTVGILEYERIWERSTFTPTVNDFSAEATQLRQYLVTVTCLNCPRPMPPVRMVAILAKLN